MTLSQKIFRVDQVLAGKIPVGDDRCRFDYNILEVEIKRLIEERLGDKEHGMSAKLKPPKIPKQCRTFVVAQMAESLTAPPTIFRSYHGEGVSKSKCAIWEAARATSAAPSFFKPMTIRKPPPPIKYVDGGLGYNNPAKLALIEAGRIWAGKNVCLVSIGTGHPSASGIVEESQLENDLEVQRSFLKVVQSYLSTLASYTIPKWNATKNIPAGVLALLKMASALGSIVTNSEAVHDVLERDAHEQFPYFRFNVNRDVGDIGLEDWKRLGPMTAHTKAYMTTFDLEKKKILCAKSIIDSTTFGREIYHSTLIVDSQALTPSYFSGPYQENPLFVANPNRLRLGSRQNFLEVSTSSSPSLAVFKDLLYMAWNGFGKDQSIYWSSFDGTKWERPQKMSGVGSSAGPSIATFNKLLYMAWNGDTNDTAIYWSCFNGGTGWAPQQRVGGVGTSGRPSLATLNNLLYMAWRGTGDDEGVYWSSFNGTAWATQQNIAGIGTSAGPSLAPFQNSLYLAWNGAGIDQSIYWSSFDGTKWETQQKMSGVGSSAGPSIVSFNKMLYMVWNGDTDDMGIYWSRFDGGTGWMPQGHIGGVLTSTRPSLTRFHNWLYMAWKGAGNDPGIYCSPLKSLR